MTTKTICGGSYGRDACGCRAAFSFDWPPYARSDDLGFRPVAEEGGIRMLRGGAWVSDAPRVRCASLNAHAPGSRDERFGFRLVAEDVGGGDPSLASGEPRIVMPELFDVIRSGIDEFYRIRDAIIRKAVSEYLGRSTWTLQEVLPHLTAQVSLDTPQHGTVSYDGVLLVTLLPITHKVEGQQLTFHQPYIQHHPVGKNK